jgi:Holliday junction resolvasome RuvABC ATP-dependent DNA helicase subunit
VTCVAVDKDSKPSDAQIQQTISTLLNNKPAKFQEYLMSQLNRTQLHAVLQAADDTQQRRTGFTLLQGPPGTGKTKTVVALLNVLHLGRYLDHYRGMVRHRFMQTVFRD